MEESSRSTFLSQLNITVLRGVFKPISGNWIFGSPRIPDSYVAVSIDGQPPKKTGIANKTSNPIWDEIFTLLVTVESIVEFKVYNYSQVRTDTLIGSAKCDIKKLLKQKHGKLEKVDLALSRMTPQ
uniref:C2 domain-containing protein n=1 Tax=Ciona savignyi TaxID=51511 RepID=H2YXT4_CIOSA